MGLAITPFVIPVLIVLAFMTRGFAVVEAVIARELRELRDLARGIHPPVLADRGLSVDVAARPAPAVESAAYFVAAEALANAAKHARARPDRAGPARRGA
jgi:hypothetical protein